MCDNSETTNESSESSTPILRNGLDYEPKKTYPPDYSSVPSTRDWQMSPFGNQRFDLDEIQRLEKKGIKAKAELENLLKMRSPEKEEKPAPEELPPPCLVCKEREKLNALNKVKCSWDYLYQPYGPSMVPSSKCALLDSSKLYTHMGPSSYADYYFKTHSGGISPVIPCADLKKMALNTGNNEYIPYGPSLGVRMSNTVYEPMGPTYPKIPM